MKSHFQYKTEHKKVKKLQIDRRIFLFHGCKSKNNFEIFFTSRLPYADLSKKEDVGKRNRSKGDRDMQLQG